MAIPSKQNTLRDLTFLMLAGTFFLAIVGLVFPTLSLLMPTQDPAQTLSTSFSPKQRWADTMQTYTPLPSQKGGGSGQPYDDTEIRGDLAVIRTELDGVPARAEMLSKIWTASGANFNLTIGSDTTSVSIAPGTELNIAVSNIINAISAAGIANVEVAHNGSRFSIVAGLSISASGANAGQVFEQTFVSPVVTLGLKDKVTALNNYEIVVPSIPAVLEPVGGQDMTGDPDLSSLAGQYFTVNNFTTGASNKFEFDAATSGQLPRIQIEAASVDIDIAAQSDGLRITKYNGQAFIVVLPGPVTAVTGIQGGQPVSGQEGYTYIQTLADVINDLKARLSNIEANP